MIRNFISWSAATAICAAGAFAGGIESMAPEDTVFILRVDNMSKTMDRARASGFADIWNAPELEDMRMQFMQGMEEGLEQFLAEIGLDDAKLKAPSGAVGLAMFLTDEDDDGNRQMGGLAIAEFGDAGEETDTIIRAILEQAEEDDLEWDEVDIRGRDVIAIKLPVPEEDEDDEFGMGMPGPNWAAMFGRPSTIFYLHDGGVVYFSTTADALDGALRVADGGDTESVGARDDFIALDSMIGDNDVSITVLTEGLSSMLMQDPNMGMGLGMAKPMLEALIGHIDGFAYGVSLDHPVALAEFSTALLMMDGKEGVFELVDENVARGSVPPFVGEDATSYMTANVEFGGVMDLIRQVIGAAPLMVQGQLIDGLATVEDDLTAFFGSLGTTVYSTSTIERPITLESQRTLFAMSCSDPEAISDLIEKFGGQMGFESRDFLGQRIYTSDMEMMPGMMGGGGDEGFSIGIGAGAMFIGGTSSVEQVLRTAGERDVETLEDNPSFARAVDVLEGDGAVAWGYTNLLDQIEYTFGAMEAMGALPPMGVDVDFLRRYIGPMVWQIRATDEGYVGQAYIMTPAEQEM